MGNWVYALAFYGLTGAALLGAAGVLVLRNLFHAGLALIVTLFCVAGLFILLGAEFLAGIQVLIYVGAIAVLILFAVMVTQRIAFQSILRQYSRAALAAFPVALALLVGAALLARRAVAPAPAPLPAGDQLTDLATALLSRYLLPFEVISLLLLGALVGALVLARKEEPK